MRHTIRIFVMALVTLTMVAGLGILAWMENRTLEDRLSRDKKAELTRLVDLLALCAEHVTGPEAYGAEFAKWAEIIHKQGDYRLSLINQRGVLLEDSHLSTEELARERDNHASRPEVIAAFRDGSGSSRRYSATEGRDYLYVAGRVFFQVIPEAEPLVLRLGSPLSQVRGTRLEVLKQYGLGAGVIVLLALAVSFWATRPLDREIKELIAAVGDLADGNYARRLVRQPKNELAFLGVAFNRLASRYSRQMTKDAATQERLLAILENMDEGVLVTDRGGRVTNSNPALARLFSLETPPKGFPGEAIRFPEFVEALSRTGRGESVPPLVLTLSGVPEKILEVRLSPLGDEYEPAGVVAVFHDLTNRQRLYKLRRDIVANVSHELRAPLAALAEAAEILGRKAAGDPELSQVVDVLARHRGRLDELSNDLLELARLESLKTKGLTREAVDTSAMLDEAAESVIPAGDEESASRLSLAVAPGAETLYVDRASLQSALRNLLDNAFKYGAPGTPVRVLAEPGPRGVVALSVANQGPALTPEDKERVFERFYRGEKSRLRSPDGYGLGLAIVKHAAQAHGGAASVESSAGETVFTIRLPQKNG